MENTLAENIIWNLGDLYSGASDPQIEADTKWLREQVVPFSTYRGKVAGLGPEDLLEAVFETGRNKRAGPEASGIRIS